MLVPTRSAHHTRHGLYATHLLGLKLVESTTCKLPSVQLKYQKTFSFCDQIKFNENVLKQETPG